MPPPVGRRRPTTPGRSGLCLPPRSRSPTTSSGRRVPDLDVAASSPPPDRPGRPRRGSPSSGSNATWWTHPPGSTGESPAVHRCAGRKRRPRRRSRPRQPPPSGSTATVSTSPPTARRRAARRRGCRSTTTTPSVPATRRTSSPANCTSVTGAVVGVERPRRWRGCRRAARAPRFGRARRWRAGGRRVLNVTSFRLDAAAASGGPSGRPEGAVEQLGLALVVRHGQHGAVGAELHRRGHALGRLHVEPVGAGGRIDQGDVRRARRRRRAPSRRRDRPAPRGARRRRRVVARAAWRVATSHAATSSTRRPATPPAAVGADGDDPVALSTAPPDPAASPTGSQVAASNDHRERSEAAGRLDGRAALRHDLAGRRR